MSRTREVNTPPDQTVPRNTAGLTRAQAAPSHNLFALTVSELGWPGLLLMAAIWARWFQMSGVFLLLRKMETVSVRFAIGAFFAVSGAFLQSLTEWEFRRTPALFLCHIIVGALAVMYYQRGESACHGEGRERQGVARERDEPTP